MIFLRRDIYKYIYMTKNNLGLVGYEVLMFLRENLKRNNLGFVGYEFVISGDASAQG